MKNLIMQEFCHFKLLFSLNKQVTVTVLSFLSLTNKQDLLYPTEINKVSSQTIGYLAISDKWKYDSKKQT